MTFAGPLRRALYRLPSVWGSRRSLVSPFVTTFREMLEMRYLWREPVRMDDARLIAALGQEPHTPLDQAVEATVVGLQCFRASVNSESRECA
jgi:nucleoside-diphosphate-sugar epimerase